MPDKWIPQEIEPKWQKKWEADGLYHAHVDPSRPKHYALTMYPYPSGDLHIGHWYAMVPSDARARWMRMRGYNVLFPMGFDAFGLPAENAAIKHKIHPKEWTYANIERMRKQLRSMGAMFDWRRECVTCEPEYYRWTQWFFLKMYDAGLAYKKMAPVDFCPTCNTTLAREQVWGEDRHCERCGTPVIKKDLAQWFLRITAYAEELLDFSGLEWPERVITMQRNWIGRSEGAEVIFRTEKGGHALPVFTTRPDTLWGATFMVLAPEHPLVMELTTDEQRAAVEAYVEQARRMADIEREAVDREKTGVFTGAYAINPVNNERIPIWVADYVLMTYGTGAIMAVPCGDQRDFEFARKYDLPIPVVVAPVDWDGRPFEQAYTEPGVMVNSGPFSGYPTIAKYSLAEWTPELAARYGLPAELNELNEGRHAVTRWLEQQGIGKFAVAYRLHDWLISRQRYWGAPIPMIECPACGIVPVPYEELPVLLPDDVEFMPTGESPLKFHEGFRYTTCPRCGGPAERETDTMDTFMCSSWYQYAYMERHWKAGQPLSANDIPFNPAEGAYWLPVDQYTGGVEHATMHLLYTRFFTKAMRDMGLVPFDEPMLRLFNQGIILGEDGEKMSKSRGNVIAPDDLVQRYGADVVRGYLMFGFRWDQGGPWSSTGVLGVQRFLERVWNLVLEPPATSTRQETADEAAIRDLRRKQHQTIRRTTQDMERFSFNTMVAALMEYSNYLVKAKETPVVHTPAWEEAIDTLLLLMAPAFPHISEELWMRRGRPYSIHQQAWPTWDEALAAEEMITIVVQVNGKVRDRFTAPADVSAEEAQARALETDGARKYLAGRTPSKVIYVPGRLVNIVL
ncbi:MAG: leucine--tRNA ligase [Anaerolineae bacterium]|nr:leucine--tRNA ligase [Anaerolineae bacterium]MDW8070320.1 leucine--tRNA ligase [Anaerolineae bacterium]